MKFLNTIITPFKKQKLSSKLLSLLNKSYPLAHTNYFKHLDLTQSLFKKIRHIVLHIFPLNCKGNKDTFPY